MSVIQIESMSPSVRQPRPDEAEIIARVIEKMQVAFTGEDVRCVVIAMCTMLPYYAEQLRNVSEEALLDELRIAFEFHRNYVPPKERA